MAIQRKVLYIFSLNEKAVQKEARVTFKKLILEDISGDLHLRWRRSGERRKLPRGYGLRRRGRNFSFSSPNFLLMYVLSSGRSLFTSQANFVITVKRENSPRCKSLRPSSSSPFTRRAQR